MRPEAEVDLTADSGIRYRILPHLSIVELVGAGASDLSDVVAVLDAALGDPVFRSGFGFLYDRRGLEPITPEQIRSVVNRLGRKEGLAGSRVALIVDPTGPAHMFHLTTVRGGAPLMLLTFHDLDQARLWLSMRGMP